MDPPGSGLVLRPGEDLVARGYADATVVGHATVEIGPVQDVAQKEVWLRRSVQPRRRCLVDQDGPLQVRLRSARLAPVLRVEEPVLVARAVEHAPQVDRSIDLVSR